MSFYAIEQIKRAHEERARRGHDFSNVPESTFPVQPHGTAALSLRDNGRFYDISGTPLWFAMQWNSGTWGG